MTNLALKPQRLGIHGDSYGQRRVVLELPLNIAYRDAPRASIPADLKGYAEVPASSWNYDFSRMWKCEG
ncbi:hypothetical protein [Chelativorans alearense]|uniref:hypothetical protein n=1 Tax=Chelativorans alearense TaxID=2681495 RepID=UPI0013D55EA3|nr:hypothetical protein [Chelativorans alearense]